MNGEKVSLENLCVPNPRNGMELSSAEALYKKYDLAYALLEKFGEESDVEMVLSCKKKISEIIMKYLKDSKLPHRKCKHCGKKLSWNYPYGMCSKCHDKLYVNNSWWDYDELW